MTKNILLTISFLLCSIISLGQSLNGPESIDYHMSSGKYLISNSNNGQILMCENINGIASNLTVLASNVGTGPHGLEVINDIVYACSGGRLKGYDINTGMQVLNYNIGGQFLNGITHKGNDIFITDFSAKKLYRYDLVDGTHHLFASFNSTPNGVLYDNLYDRLVSVGWGNNAPIWEISLIDSTVSVIVSTNYSNIDGITHDPCENYYISVWGTNTIYQYSGTLGSNPQPLVGFQSQPADIYYEPTTQTLAIPNSGNNSINFISIPCGSSEITEEEPLDYYINSNYIVFKDEREKKIYNSQGQLIWKGNSQKISKSKFKPGVYILHDELTTQKIIL